jgi:hypothetical protein
VLNRVAPCCVLFRDSAALLSVVVAPLSHRTSTVSLALWHSWRTCSGGKRPISIPPVSAAAAAVPCSRLVHTCTRSRAAALGAQSNRQRSSDRCCFRGVCLVRPFSPNRNACTAGGCRNRLTSLALQYTASSVSGVHQELMAATTGCSHRGCSS